MKRRISLCSHRGLPLGGKLVMVKSVLEAILVYYMGLAFIQNKCFTRFKIYPSILLRLQGHRYPTSWGRISSTSQGLSLPSFYGNSSLGEGYAKNIIVQKYIAHG